MEQLVQMLIKQHIAAAEEAQEHDEWIGEVVCSQLQQAGTQMAASQDWLKQIGQIFQQVNDEIGKPQLQSTEA